MEAHSIVNTLTKLSWKFQEPAATLGQPKTLLNSKFLCFPIVAGKDTLHYVIQDGFKYRQDKHSKIQVQL